MFPAGIPGLGPKTFGPFTLCTEPACVARRRAAEARVARALRNPRHPVQVAFRASEDESRSEAERATQRRRYLQEYSKLLALIPDNGTWVAYGGRPLCEQCALRLAGR
jgi:hypothetical protein